jgi:hypothetical protein
VTCQEFSKENPANGSQLTDTVFNISIRVLDFDGIRGLDEFDNGATVPFVTYPGGGPEPEKLAPGVHRRLISPFRPGSGLGAK